MASDKRPWTIWRCLHRLLIAVVALLVLSVQNAPVGAQQAPSASLAQDARSLSDESSSTQALFTAVWGDQAPARWIVEHDLELAGGEVPHGPRIGVLYQGVSSATLIHQFLAGFIRGLREAGYAPGKDLLIDWRFAEGRLDLLPALANELVSRQPAVIVALLSQEAVAVHTATSSVPIVTVNVPDPVGSGLAASLEQPGGNVTGMAGFPPVSARALELLKQVVPAATRVAVFVSNATGGPSPSAVEELHDAAPRLGVQLLIEQLRSADDLPDAFGSAQAEQADALIWVPGSGDGVIYTPNIPRIVNLAEQTGLPMMHLTRQAVDIGGLMSYGPNGPETYRRAAGYVARILAGARPEDLPMQRASSFDFVINIKAAQSIGLSVVQSVVDQATEIIR